MALSRATALASNRKHLVVVDLVLQRWCCPARDVTDGNVNVFARHIQAVVARDHSQADFRMKTCEAAIGAVPATVRRMERWL